MKRGDEAVRSRTKRIDVYPKMDSKSCPRNQINQGLANAQALFLYVRLCPNCAVNW